MWFFWSWSRLWSWLWFWSWFWSWLWFWSWFWSWFFLWFWSWLWSWLWPWRWCWLWCWCWLWFWRFFLLLSSSEADTKIHILLLNTCLCHRLSDIPCHRSLSLIVHMHLIYHFESFDLETNRFIGTLSHQVKYELGL